MRSALAVDVVRALRRKTKDEKGRKPRSGAGELSFHSLRSPDKTLSLGLLANDQVNEGNGSEGGGGRNPFIRLPIVDVVC
ncbi:hypothetical protein KQX54_021882 [Cotesia glomerata]|uniref:Uncharacterized protein n=1 Tax=Cotesia glomerata TaxID=32391 RepID=A0AAV7J7P5_COTGL|nr:hypothetical protein KQX54_021882 [Cotesia glomerata]